ncbi:MAG: OmpA family protein [Desulfobulbaceae bacterium]|uniref:OmpA family protein n=1 Tax=Candidatus Desulfobia pelagia TaxID=2841692 RepID=A0A8J6NAY0_9BACT|nr:OmpA family protein [Candidatus Desulfobia pelagia]
MKFFNVKQASCLLLALSMSGCAVSHLHPPPPVEKFSSDLMISRLNQGGYLQKTDNLMVVMDALGTSYDGNNRDMYQMVPKIEFGQEILTKMSDTIPPVTHTRALRVFGSEAESFKEDYSLSFGLLDIPPQSIPGIIATKTLPESSISPLALTLDNALFELKEIDGATSLVVMSDGLNVDRNAMLAAKRLKRKYGDSLCIYTILLGDSPEGASHLDSLAELGKCGFDTRADDINNQTAMTDFVEQVFFAKIASVAIAPPAALEHLPKLLPQDKTVSIELNVEFDFDKAAIKPQFHNEIKKVADFMKRYPFTNTMLEGHTDSKGTHAYNDKLSLSRVTSVRQYLIDKFGVDAGRLSVRGAGEREPVASNDTAEGRQRNRRVVAVIKAVMKEFRAE